MPCPPSHERARPLPSAHSEAQRGGWPDERAGPFPGAPPGARSAQGGPVSAVRNDERLWQDAAALVESALGLHFPPGARSQLERGFAAAGRDLGCDDGRRCAQRLLAAPHDRAGLRALAQRLTIGETYFYRDPWALEAISREVLAPLIAARCRGERRLSLWSAGCSSGEETYTLAALVHRLLPQRAGWDIAIVGSDVNASALRRAEAGVYDRWSLRKAPAWMMGNCLEALPDGRHRVRPALRALVRFAVANLVDAGGDSAPVRSPVDLIVCRNVLMYLSPAQAAVAIERLRRHLTTGGWLVLSDTEVAAQPWPGFDLVIAGRATLLRRRAEAPSTAAAPATPPAAARDAPVARATGKAGSAAAQAAHIEDLADAGRLKEALHCCAAALAEHPGHALLHCLHGMVLSEQGQAAAARQSLQQALALDPGLALAHFALGALARAAEQDTLAQQHYAHARQSLARLPQDAPLAGSRLSARQLTQVLAMIDPAPMAPTVSSVS